MLIFVLIWLAVGFGLALLTRRYSAGLPLAYFLGLSLIHVPGAILFLDSGLSKMAIWTRLGFEQTVIGMAAFLVAVAIARYRFVRELGRPISDGRPHLSARSLAALERSAPIYFGFGGVTYFIMMPLLGNVPSSAPILSSLGSLIVVGACLLLWVTSQNRNRGKFWSTVAFLPLLPLATVVQGGFIGFGTYWVLGIGSFLFAQSKRHLRYLLIAPVVALVGISVFVNYMAARNDIRRTVWIEQADFGDRLQRVIDGIFQNFEWVDFSNQRHRFAIESRLNQNWLIGAAMERLESGTVEYASGASLGSMLVAVIPRAIWSDKPAVGGGGTLVHDFTGIRFAEGTSVGAGQVLEFYVNFGTLGVIAGFLAYGWLLGRIDLKVAESLYRGDRRRFLLWFLIGVALLQPGGNLLEIVVSAAGAAVTGYGLGVLMDRHRPPSDVVKSHA
jgi:hypothetical protein